MQSLASKTFTNAKVYNLQDATETAGFLYKKGCFFYEGTLKDTSMQGHGRLNMMAK